MKHSYPATKSIKLYLQKSGKYIGGKINKDGKYSLFDWVLFDNALKVIGLSETKGIKRNVALKQVGICGPGEEQ